MLSHLKSIFLFMSIAHCLSVNPGGICPNEDYISTGTYSIDMSSTYNSTFTNPMTITIPLNKAQTDNVYAVGITIQKLNYLINARRIVLFLSTTSKNQSSIGAQLSSVDGNRIQVFGIRYVTISSVWSFIMTNQITTTFNVWIPPASYASSVLLPVANMNLSGTYKWYRIPIGWDLMANDSTTQIGIWIFPTISNSNNIKIDLFTSSNKPIYVGSIRCFTIFIKNSNLAGLGTIDTNQLSKPNPLNFSISTNQQFNFFYGVTQFRITNQLFFNFNAQILNNTNRIALTTTNNMTSLRLSYIRFQTLRPLTKCCPYNYSFLQNRCFDQCPISYQSNNYNCIPIRCSYNCLKCLDVNTCQTCMIGIVIQGGCTSVDGCIAITHNSTLSPSICIDCAFPMYVYNQTCICPSQFWIITRLCTNVVGCISTALVNNTVKCNACNILKILYLINGKCQCFNGFFLNQSQICQQICGDGQSHIKQCDDGNNIDGDGCSSTCTVQNKYNCFNGSKVSSSHCVYFGRDFRLKLSSIDKIDFENKGVFIFKVFPVILNFQKMNLMNSLVFASNRAATVVQQNYSRGQIKIVVQYTEDLQDFMANLTLTFNTSIIMQAPVDINFTMTSRGAKLIIVKNYQLIKIISYFLISFSCTILFLFVLGSLFHKMVGIETLHAFQLIFFIHQLNKSYTTPFSMFKFLTYLNCNFLYLFNLNLSIPHPNQSFFFSANSQQFANMIIIGLSLASLIIFSVIKIREKTIKQQQDKQKYVKIGIRVYNKAVFPIFMAFFWTINLSSVKILNNQSSILFQNIPKIVDTLINLIFKIACSFIICFESKGLLTIQTCKQSYYGLSNSNRRHIPIYLLYMNLINVSLTIQYLGLFDYSQIIIAIFNSLLLIKFCCHKPYKSSLHNAGVIFNLIMVQLFLIWTFTRNVFIIIEEEDKQILLIGIFFLVMFASIIINSARIIFEIKKIIIGKFVVKMIQQNHQYIDQNQVQIKHMQNEQMIKQSLNQMNKYCLKVMKQKDEFNQWNQHNKKRLLTDMEVIYGSTHIKQKVDGIQKVFKKREQKIIKQQNERKKIKQRLKKDFKQKYIGKERQIFQSETG